MAPVSVVLIAKNEAHVIGKTIKVIQRFTDDIIVVDSGSTDGTQAIVQNLNARLIETAWVGFGLTKNIGIAAAKYDWILSIDADEIPDEILLKSIAKLQLKNASVVYKINFKTYFGKKLIRFGEWGKDAHVRLFNRTTVKWNDANVHEQLVLSKNVVVKNTEGYIHHYTMKDTAEFTQKMTQYALLNAERYYLQGKKAGWIKRTVSPAFSFLLNYFFKLGFLDGREGFLIAKVNAWYTHLKYARLYELTKS